MKRQILVAFSLLALLMVGSTAFAQSSKMTATVPFDFVVGNKLLPAGQYVMTPLGMGSQALALQNVQSKEMATVLVNEIESLHPSSTGKLVFHEYAGEYFLREIWGAGNGRGRELPRTRHEQEMAKAMNSRDVIELGALR